MTPALYSPQELEMLANQELAYASGYDELEIINAAGYEDMLEFSGAGAPTLTASQGDRVIKFNIDNNDTSNVARFLLHAGHRNKQLQRLSLVAASGVTGGNAFSGGTLVTQDMWVRREGLIRSGAFAPISKLAGQLDITATSVGAQSIENVLAYLEEFPTPVTAIDIVSDSEQQMGQVLTIRKITPFKEGETNYLDPLKATDQNTFQSRRARFNTLGLVLDENVEVEYSILPGTNLTISLYCGASFSKGNTMRAAQRNVINAGTNRFRAPGRR